MSRLGNVRRFLTIALAVPAAMLLLFASTGRVHRPDVLYNALAALLFSALIGGPLQLILPRVSPLIFARFQPPVTWLLMIAVMMATAAAGSAVALGLLIAGGALPAGSFGTFFVNALRISLVITLTFGIGISLYERMRKRADAAELALRTKERDEAEARRALADARLNSLEARVQPHFLFNALNSIAALIPQDPAGAERMTGQLASLLRASLDLAGTPLVPLRQELGTVRNYLEIEQVRFGERLQYTIDVPQALDATLVPRLSLQTLVENSVKFAVSPRRQGAALRLTAANAGDSVRLTVEDDGPGFGLDEAPAHHGLDLLRERLLLSYGGRARLAAERAPGSMRVTLEVPR